MLYFFRPTGHLIYIYTCTHAMDLSWDPSFKTTNMLKSEIHQLSNQAVEDSDYGSATFETPRPNFLREELSGRLKSYESCNTCVDRNFHQENV